MRRLSLLWVTVCISLVSAATAHGTIVDMTFTGHVSQNVFLPPQLAGQISPGDPVSGRFLYDSSLGEGQPGAGEGDWYLFGQDNFIALTAGQAHFAPVSGFTAQVLNDLPIDSLLFKAYFDGPWEVYGSIGPSYVQLQFRDDTLAALDSTSLPDSFPPLTVFQQASGVISVIEDASKPPTLSVPFSIDDVHPVPEPAPGLALCAALCALVAGRARART
jgi:hypothetical protein